MQWLVPKLIVTELEWTLEVCIVFKKPKYYNNMNEDEK